MTKARKEKTRVEAHLPTEKTRHVFYLGTKMKDDDDDEVDF